MRFFWGSFDLPQKFLLAAIVLEHLMQSFDAIKYFGVNDQKTDFSGERHNVPLGMSYKSYLIIGKKITFMDRAGMEKSFLRKKERFSMPLGLRRFLLNFA